MLKVSDNLALALTRDSFVTKVIAFLKRHVEHSDLKILLGDKDFCVKYWNPLLDKVTELPEHTLAVLMSYSIACEALGIRPKLLEDNTADGQIAMMMQLEDWSVVRFSAWDG